MRIANSTILKPCGSIPHRFSTLLLFLCLLKLFFLTISFAYAQDIEERLKSIKKEIRRYEEYLKKEQEREFSVLNELERLNSELAQIREKIRTNKRRLRDIEGKLSSTQKEIETLELRLKSRLEWLKKKLRSMWVYGYMREMEFLLSSRDGGEFLRSWRYLTLLARYDTKMMNSIKKDIEELRKKTDELSNIRKEIRATLSRIEEEELSLLRVKKEKGVLLGSIREKKDYYEKMLKELNESARRLSKIIEESRIKGTPEEDRGFFSKRGRLPWPVNGRIKIPFGNQKDPLTGVPVFRSGVYILAEEDSAVQAVYGGRVAYTGELKGYGKVIIISHGGNYHTVYANLSEIFFKTGDIILEKQTIGRVGESQLTEGMVLYFEVRYKGKPLDPLQWLKKR